MWTARVAMLLGVFHEGLFIFVNIIYLKNPHLISRDTSDIRFEPKKKGRNKERKLNFIMQLLLPLLFSGSLISALPLTKRDASTVLSDLSTISSDVASLDADVTSYDGSFSQSIPLIIAVDGLESELKTATSDTTAAGDFSDTDSESIVTAINNLTPNIIQLLTDLDAKVYSLPN
jgi:hypothetical protein